MAMSGGLTSAAHSMAVGEGLQFFFGCWKVASVTYHMALYTGLVDCPLLWQLTSLCVSHPREGEAAAAEPRRHALTWHAGFQSVSEVSEARYSPSSTYEERRIWVDL